MSKIKEYAGVVALVAIVLLVVLGLVNQRAPVAGGVTNYDTVEASGLAIGSGCNDFYGTCTGATYTQTYSGTCTLVSDSSIAATSTGTGTCAISGLLAGDKVYLDIATTSVELTRQIVPIGVIAGTNSATVRLFNLTGTAAVPGAVPGFGSSTPYTVWRGSN